MSVFCFGSINIDHFYTLPNLPTPGETLAARSYRTELGGKGANQSVAAARAGAKVHHLGAVGADGAMVLAQLAAAGVDTSGVQVLADVATGTAIVMVDAQGENAIILHAGANRALSLDDSLRALEAAEFGDILLMQNETAHGPQIARAAQGKGVEVIYSAAPFDLDHAKAMLPHVNVLVVNAIEAAQLQAAMGLSLLDLPVDTVVVTQGAAGASWHARGWAEIHVDALPAQVVDTTGAGDCFTGALAAALDRGDGPEAAMRFAAAAASVQVSRRGAAGAMPSLAEIDALLG
jgi:ribokinase